MTLRSLRKAMLVALTHKVALPVLRKMRTSIPFPYTGAQLAEMEDGSVGKALFYFHKRNGLQLISQYEQHDVKHVLLGYRATECGEVCLQMFLIGNGNGSLPSLLTAAFGLLLMPDCWSRMYAAFKRGKCAGNINSICWSSSLSQPLISLRNQLNLHRRK